MTRYRADIIATLEQRETAEDFTTFVSTCLTEWVSSRSISTKTCL